MQSLDDLISRLEFLTGEIMERLSVAAMEDVEEFVLQRDALIEQIVSVRRTPEERASFKDRVEVTLRWDDLIVGRMNKLKEEAQDGLKKMSLGKVQRGAYEIDYTPDSVFFDRKK
ncbi:flagellar protein FliT [Paenibacillus allorhizosphaerae]|uniref:Flagellar protein FliT n=1 Tax=Paenibacillus allorhizosphaerae TaxID=2849866 RepID=A0ABN7TUB0_9BACL|nr:flagellar protein FliT [Paenibacillus allorhizosphaerae]CAG7656154.1 hypothetical protein PAECIP111802_06317 [Paenibacillus allorhizosphaerae]